MRKRRLILTVALVFFVLFGTGSAMAAEKVEFILNWIAGGDHAPYYYALQQGWYKDAGIDLYSYYKKCYISFVQANNVISNWWK